jgi:undecaprenyl-diphosphatase
LGLLLSCIALGVLQGLTEFLPVSSSGHLVMLQGLLGFKENPVAFDLLLHLATLGAVFLYFRKDLWGLTLSLFPPYSERREERRLVVWLVLATAVTAVIGLGLKHQVEALFSTPKWVAGALIYTGLLLFAGDWVESGDLSSEDAGLWRSALVGLFQGMAVFPGVSRSGSTVVAAILTGMSREEAGRFSFLLAVPAILGAAVLESPHLTSIPHNLFLPYLAGMLAAFVVGYAAIEVFLKAIKTRSLKWFGLYCCAVAVAGFLVFSR